MFKLNTQMAEQLRPVARQNEQHIRELAAKARQLKDYAYAHRIDKQATRWRDLGHDAQQRA